jgi:hypothetical protein
MTTAFQMSSILGNVANVIIGAVMLRSGVFGKATAHLSFVTGTAGFGSYLPAIGLFLSVVMVLFIGIWSAMVARALVQLGRGVSRAAAYPG